MSNTEQKQKILLKRTTEVDKQPIPSGASHGELFLNIASGANAHNKIATMQIGTNEAIIWSDDATNEKKFALKTEVEALVKEVEDNELVTATAISTMNASAGFNEDGSSVLEGGMTLSEAIIDLQARAGVIEESDPIFAKSAASGITSADITNWNNKMDAVDRISSAYTSYSADTSVSAKTSVNAVSASTSVSAETSVSATTSTKAIQDGDGNVISSTYASKTELENLIQEVEDSEFVTANALTQINKSAGFTEGGSSVLEGGVSLSQAIIDLQARAGVIEESDPIFAKSAASGITSADITNWNNKMDAVDRISSAYTSYSADTSVSATTAKSASTVTSRVPSASTSYSATTAKSASTVTSRVPSASTSYSAITSTKAIQDGDGNVISSTYASKTELENLIQEVEDNELVTATAISTMNASAGFNEDGSSVLEGGMTLSEAIIDLQARAGVIEELENRIKKLENK